MVDMVNTDKQRQHLGGHQLEDRPDRKPRNRDNGAVDMEPAVLDGMEPLQGAEDNGQLPPAEVLQMQRAAITVKLIRN